MTNKLIFVFLISIALTGTLHAKKLTLYSEEFPPFTFTEQSKFTGVCTEIVQHVMSKAGIEYQIKSLPWEESYNQVQKETNALIFSINRSSEREDLFRWVGILMPTTYSVLTLKSRSQITIDNIIDLKKFKVGTTKGDIVESWLSSKGFSTSDLIRSSGDNTDLKNYRNLLNKKTDVWISPDVTAYYIVRKQGHSDPKSLLNKAYPIEELSSGSYIAASLTTSDAVVSKVSNALRAFKKTDEYYKILLRWGVDTVDVRTDDPIIKLIYTFRNFNRLTKVGFLASDKITSHRDGGMYRKEMREQFVEAYVGTFGQWREKYTQLQSQVDALIIGDITGIKEWNDVQAKEFIQTETKIPTGCLIGSIVDYAMFSFDSNTFIINTKIAQQLGRKIPNSFLKKANRIIK